MPSSVLTINTAQFDAALRRSATELGKVEIKATGVDKALATMTSKFSGATLERELRIAAAAVDKVGGAAVLTTRQSDALLQKTRELQAQYRAIGQTAPAEIEKLADALEDARKASSGASSGLAGFLNGGGAVAAGAMAGAVAAVGTAAINAAGNLARMAVDGVGALVARGGEIAALRAPFVAMAGGVAEADRMIAGARTATRGLVSDFDLAAQASNALTLELPITAAEYARLAGAAVTLGRAMRVGPVDSIAAIVTGLGKGSAEVLNNVGIVLRADDAYAAYGRQIGKAADALTAKEKQIAVYRAGLDAAERKVASMGGVQLTFADRLLQTKVGLQNMRDALAEAIGQSPALNAAAAVLGETLVGAFGADKQQAIARIVTLVNQAALAAVDAGTFFAKLGKIVSQVVTFGLSGVAGLTATVLRLAEATANAAAYTGELLPGSMFDAAAAGGRKAAAALGQMASEAEAVRAAWRQDSRGEAGLPAFFAGLDSGLASARASMVKAIESGQQYTSGLGDAEAAAKAAAAAAAAAANAALDKATKDRTAAEAAKAHAKAIEAQVDAMRKLAGIDVAEDAARLVATLRGLEGIGLKIAPAEAAGAVETLRAGIAALESQGMEVDRVWRDYLVTLEDLARGHEIAGAAAKAAGDVQKAAGEATREAFARVLRLQDEISDARALQGVAPQWRKLIELAFDYRDAVKNVSDGQTFLRRELERLGANVTPELRRQLEAIAGRLDSVARVELERLGEKFGITFEEAVLNTRELRDALLVLLDGLAAINPAARAAADQIRELYPDKDGKDPAKAPRDLADAWVSALGDMSRALSEFAQISGDGLDGTAGKLAELVGLMNLGAQAGKAIGAGIRQGGVGGYAQAATGGIQAATAIYAATNVEGRGQRALRGAGTGASAGFTATAATGNPYLIAGATTGGAIVGALIGAFRKPGFEVEMKRVSASFGVTIAKEFAGAIDKARGQFGGDRQATELSFLPQIIEAAGGVNGGNVDKLTARLRDVFSMLDQGKFTADQARQTLDAAFPAFANHVTESGKVASRQFVELIELNRRMGTESKAIGEFVATQAQRMGAAATALLAPASKMVADLQAARDKALAGVRDGSSAEGDRAAIGADYAKQLAAAGEQARPEIERVARLMAAGFNAAVAQGGDLLSVLEEFGPGLDRASALMRDLGINSADTAIAGVAAFREKVQINRELVESTQALNEFTLALSNVGGLTADTFGDVQAQVRGQIEALRAAGFTDAEAFSVAKASLETVIDASRRLKLPVDEGTAAILEQARAAGVLEAAGTGTNDILREGFGLLIELLGGEVPAAWQRSAAAALEAGGVVVEAQEAQKAAIAEVNAAAADPDGWRALARSGTAAAAEVTAALDRIPRTVAVGVAVDGDARPEGSFATGSMGVRNFGSGTLAMLHGREAVVPEWQYRRRFDAGAFPSGGAGGGAVAVIVELDGDVLAEGVLPAMGGRLAVRGIA